MACWGSELIPGKILLRLTGAACAGAGGAGVGTAACCIRAGAAAGSVIGGDIELAVGQIISKDIGAVRDGAHTYRFRYRLWAMNSYGRSLS